MRLALRSVSPGQQVWHQAEANGHKQNLFARFLDSKGMVLLTAEMPAVAPGCSTHVEILTTRAMDAATATRLRFASRAARL